MYEKELEVAKGLAKEAGEIMLKYFEGDLGTKFKENNTPVTKADLEINELVIEELNKAFPEDGIVAEERSTAEYGMGRRWVCDPIDGTVAFVWGLATSMFSLALVVDGEPHVAVAYDPYLQRLYTSIKNQGSFVNEKKLEVSERTEIVRSHIAVTSSAKKIREAKFVQRLIDADAYMPVFSGCVHKSCQVARGQFDGYIEIAVSGYDTAAVTLLVEEAGGKVTGIDGEPLDFSKPFKGAIISNGHLHDKLVEICNAK